MKLKVLIIVLAVILFVLFQSVYIVDETQQVVLTQFGKVIGEAKTKPGIYFKIPVIQKPNYFAKNLLEWDGDPGEIPTQDKTYIWVDAFARWKIVDPLRFFKTVYNETGAQSRLDDILDSEIRNKITSYPLIETVRKSNRPLDFGIEKKTEDASRVLDIINTGRNKIVQGIIEQARPKLADLGIELVDLKIKRLNYTEQVQNSVFSRMIAERKQIAEKFRSEGQGEARKIEGDQERELKRITSEAYKTAQEIMGKADAEATKIYAEAYTKDPDFYSFIKSLDVYKTSMDKESTVVLSTDSEFLKYLKGAER
ncbi:Protein HflC [uncultured Desulfobacterium sp.]|uniref:Protein HflC n=1 Tax=uncultured Desulfobacterium sp. TaxID=201089 RepID=A0A445MRG3_9BACT|nr:Protein HflC [uncultured Desulfobacterium sp.]